jgi:hypothetical protein
MTITSKVTGKILDAAATPLCGGVAEKVDAVAAATIPRGAIQPVKPRSPAGRPVPTVLTRATSGLATRINTAAKANTSSTRPRSEAGVTVAEMDTNSTPMISWTSV